MRIEDLSQAGSTHADGQQGPAAHDDYDVIQAGAHAPAHGNAISGAGTVSGIAGADALGAGHAVITAISGAGGTDSSLTAGHLDIAGKYGVIRIDSHGNYTYTPNAGSPDGVTDTFTYTLTDRLGAHDSAQLAIRIEGVRLDLANAEKIVAGPDGTITLPPGVQLSDIHVVGRDLVIDMPDGSHKIVVDGAVFVPHLVLGDVEVPPTNLAALLIDSEPQPAAGPPQSSGGNFAVPVGPLDPGVPLGDLIPPTELSYQPPEFRETYIPVRPDHIPTILIETPDNPAGVVNAVDSVDEAGLPASRGPGESAGTNASADSEMTTGTIVYTSPDTPNVITINGVAVTLVNQVIHGAYGDLTITSIAPGAIGYSYLLLDNTDNTSSVVTHDDFAIALTDSDGDVANATLTINIVDDVPTAVLDTNSVTEGATITVNAAAGVLVNDTFGADGKTVPAGGVVGVRAAGGDTTTAVTTGTGSTITGLYGTLTLNADGSYSYHATSNTITANQTDTFVYTIKDGDGDLSTTTLAINVANVTLAADNQTKTVNEAALDTTITGSDVAAGTVTGSNPSSTAETATGTLVVAGATSYAVVGSSTGSYGTLVLNANGTYAYTLTSPYDTNPDANNTTNTELARDVFSYTATDANGNTITGTISINIVDDVPTNFSPVDLIDQTGATATLQDNALVNDGNALVTRLINDADNNGVGENFMGADGFGSLTFTGGVNGAQLQSDGAVLLSSGGNPIYIFGWGTGVLTATTDATNSSAAAIVFTATLNANGGYGSASTYTLDFNQTVDDGSGFVFSSFSTAPAGQNQWIGLDSDGNAINLDNNNSPDVLITATAGGTINTSSSDIGSNNQWIDGGEGVRVDFVTDVRTGTGDEKVAQGYTFDGHYTVTDSSFQIIQGGPASVRIQAVLDSDSPPLTTLSGPPVQIDATSIVVTNGGVIVPPAGYTVYNMGDGSFVITGLDAGDKVTFDTNGVPFNAVVITSAADVLNTFTPAPADTFGGAHFSVGAFGFHTASSGHPIGLTLGVTATDADGDTSTGTINVTLTPVPVAPPVVLDTNHDGQINYLSTDAGVLYDMNHDGTLDHTAWVAPGDSILFRDADHNGTVSDSTEFVFGQDGMTDMEALHAQYGAQLDASDEDFTQFALWNDANSNGIVDAGEVQSLVAAGITSISLVSDGVAASAANGDVQVAGSSTFTYVNDNGQTVLGKVDDAAFAYKAGENDLELRLAGTANSGVVAAAVAAMGLAAGGAASHADSHADHGLDRAAEAGGLGQQAAAHASAATAAGGDYRSLIGSEHSVPANDSGQVAVSSAVHELSAQVDHSLNGDHGGPISQPAALLASAAAIVDTAQSMVNVAPVQLSAEVGAKALVASGNGGVQHGGEVAKVLADAVEHGGPSIDAVLANLPASGAAAALQALASHGGDAVPAWDNGHFGGFTPEVIALITTEAMVLHHDAVQPVVNG